MICKYLLPDCSYWCLKIIWWNLKPIHVVKPQKTRNRKTIPQYEKSHEKLHLTVYSTIKYFTLSSCDLDQGKDVWSYHFYLALYWQSQPAQ